MSDELIEAEILNRWKKNPLINVGPAMHWFQCLKNGVWAYNNHKSNYNFWKALQREDVILFYSSTDSSSVVGFGIVACLYERTEPFWEQEILEGKSLWPNGVFFSETFWLGDTSASLSGGTYEDRITNFNLNAIPNKDIRASTSKHFPVNSSACKSKQLEITDFIISEFTKRKLVKVTHSFIDIGNNVSVVKFETHKNTKAPVKNAKKKWTLLSTLCCYFVLRHELENKRSVQLRNKIHSFFGMSLDSVEWKIDKNLKDEFYILNGEERSNKGSTTLDKYVAKAFQGTESSKLEKYFNWILSRQYPEPFKDLIIDHFFEIFPTLRDKDEIIIEMSASGFPVNLSQGSIIFELHSDPVFEDAEDETFVKDLKKAKNRFLLSEDEIQQRSNIKPIEIESTHKSYKRDGRIAWTALERAGHLCEIDSKHLTFRRIENDFNYVEPHHLIPISYQTELGRNLDLIENIVSLCPNCHKGIHYASKEDRKRLIKIAYDLKKELLETRGIKISLEEIFKFYNIKI